MSHLTALWSTKLSSPTRLPSLTPPPLLPLPQSSCSLVFLIFLSSWTYATFFYYICAPFPPSQDLNCALCERKTNPATHPFSLSTVGFHLSWILRCSLHCASASSAFTALLCFHRLTFTSDVLIRADLLPVRPDRQVWELSLSSKLKACTHLPASPHFPLAPNKTLNLDDISGTQWTQWACETAVSCQCQLKCQALPTTCLLHQAPP